MKKLFILILMVMSLIPNFVYAEEKLVPNAKSAILVDVNTGTILYEKNKDERLAVASLTKMMSQILILEAHEAGKFNWEDKIKASSNAAGYGGSQIYLEPGEEMTARDLMKGISMASANDATVVLAEYVGGSEEKFVSMMNKKAKELGLKNTNFKNPTGLDEDNHYSSSYDLSLIARELLKHQEILEFSSLYEDYLREDTNNRFWLVNTNKLVRLYEGTDGLKTGFTDNAGYTMAVTTKRGNTRLLAIVLGEKEGKVRNSETRELLEYGFNNYESKLLKKKGEIVDSIKLKKANTDKVDVILAEDATVLIKKGDNNKEYTQKIVLDDIELPLKENSKIGTLEIYDGNKRINSIDLLNKKALKKNNLFNIYIDNLKNIIIGNLDF